MPFEIAPLLPEDAVEFGQLDAEAMKDRAFAQAMERDARQKGKSRQEMITEWMKVGLVDPDPKNVWIKVRDTASGEIIAGANWVFQLEPEAAKPQDDDPAPVEDPPTVLGTSRKQWQVLMAQYVGRQPYLNLRVLVTHPRHQRKGAGGMLVAWGCQKADEAGAVAVLQASPAGLGLYLKHGFEITKEYEFDLRPFGTDKIETMRFMIRQPQPQPQP